MNRNIIVFFFLLLASVFNGLAQQACDLILVPEGNNLCILERNSYDFSVIKACRGNTVNYRAYSPSAISYEWTVVGGNYQLNNNGTICQVTWGEGYSGMVIVEALLQDSTVCSRWIQIVLEDKPTAGVISMPNYIVDVNNPEEKWIEVCAGDTLSFVDNSTSGNLPIIDYYWEFPYGVSNNRSISFVARDPGSFHIIHRVYNECGCYDEVHIKLIVKDECPLELSCFGTVCAYSQRSYSLQAPDCSDYLWNVQGGTIVSPQHSPEVVVQWDAPESGYGMLYLDGASCECECKSRKSIKIPVISDNVNINGRDTLCVDNQYAFSVPLWGGTHYSWDVSPMTGIDTMTDNNNLTLTPRNRGTYTVSVTYSCGFLGCGPYTLSKVIEVQASLEIVSTPSDNEVCKGTDMSFATEPEAICQWTVKLNDSTIHTENGPALGFSFDMAGTYIIQARSTDFCNEAMIVVNVQDNPPAPTMIFGPDTICPNYSAEYSAIPSSPDYYILWEWTANGTTHTYSGNKVNITFGNTVNDINVYQVSRRTGCRSEATVYPVSPFCLAEWPYNDIIRVCQGQSITLSSLRDQSGNDVLYEWKVVPAEVLSIQDDNLTANVTLLANYSNNLPTTAKLILKRVYCGTYQYDTAYVRIGEIDPPAIIHNPVCAGQGAAFSVTNPDDADQSSTYWYIDGDTENRVFGVPADLFFNNTLTHTVHLHYVSRFGCEVDADTEVNPCPALPSMRIDTSGGTLSVVIEGDATGYSYRWMTGETTPSIVASPDSYWCIVTSPECGCTRKLSHIQYVPGPGCRRINTAFGIVNHCYNIISIGNLNATGLGYPVSLTLTQNGQYYHHSITTPGQRIMVPDTGRYTVTVSWSYGDSCYYSIVGDSIQQAIKVNITNDCQGHLVTSGHHIGGAPAPITVQVYDLSNTIVGMNSGLGQAVVSIPDTGWYQARLVFGNANCYFDTMVHFDAHPTIQSIDVGSILCEQTSFTFSANATGEGLNYLWKFGDNSWNYGNCIDHVYGRPMEPHVILTVIDRNGCSVSQMVEVTVKHNYLNDENAYRIRNTYSPICPGDSAVIQTGQSPNNIYSWHPCSQFTGYFANVYETGNYMVGITTISEHCRKQFEINVPYPNGPFASILCDSSYCLNDVAELVGGVGSEYTYKWYVHSSHNHDSATTATFNYRLVDTGLHQVILLVSDADGCTSTDTAWFRVHPTPPAPTLQFCGNPCITNGPVEICSMGGLELLWSNGTKGSSALYFTDGSAGAYYIDATTGCKSHGATILIPEAPDFDGLLTGCYCVDDKYMPTELMLYTLGNTTVLPWEWNLFGSPICNGTIPPSPSPLIIPSDGEYQLLVSDYGLGCQAMSPTLTIETKDCKYEIRPNEIPSVWGVVMKKNCEQTGCTLKYEITVSICNGTDEPVCIDNLYPTVPISYSVSTGIPVTLNPGECQDITFNMSYDYSSPSSFVFVLTCGGESVGAFVVSLSDWMDCVRPDTCVFNTTYSFTLDQSLSLPNQSAFFNFGLSLPSPSANVISVWCDQGQIIDGNSGGASYSGLLMMDYGLMTQLVVDNAVFCFHIVCCDNGRICVSDICIPYSYLWEMCGLLEPRGHSKMGNSNGGNLSVEEEKSFLLVPNPATNTVRIESRKNKPINDEILLIEVFSMNGQKVLSQESSSQFDVSRLSCGTFIVKVVTTSNDYEYLKLIKQ